MKKITIFLGICIFIISFILYNLTLAPTILWNDSAELITVAYTLGIAHPTGYPSFILLGKLFSFLPFDSVAFKLNLMSAFFSSLTVIILFFILVKLTKNNTISFISTLVLTFSYTFWDQATFTDVYPLHLLLFSLLLLILVIYSEKENVKFMYLFVFFYGLSFTNHLLTILMLPSAVYFILIKEHKTWLKIKLNKPILDYKKIILILLFFIIGLLPYLYLPIRSSQNPVIDWGDTENALNFIMHITGREYAFKMFNFSGIFEQIPKQMINLFVRQFIIIFGIIGLIGIIQMYQKNFKYFIFCVILSCSYLFFTLTYDIGDIIYYYMPLYLIYTIFIAFGLKSIYDKFIEYAKIRKAIFIFCASVCLILMIAINYKSVDKSNQFFAYNYGKNLIKSLDKNAILFTNGDFDLYPVWYYTLVENNSKSPLIIDTVLLTKPWYVHQLKQRKDLKISYNKSIPFYYPTKKEPEIVLTEVMKNIIDNNIRNKSIYITIYFYQESEVNLSEKYVITPKNHLYKIETQRTKVVDLDLDYPGLFNSRIKKDEMTEKMISNLCVYLGLYYFNKQDVNASIEKFVQATKINPKSFVAYANLGYLYFIGGDYKKALSAYQKAYEIDPKNEEIHNNIIAIKSILGYL